MNNSDDCSNAFSGPQRFTSPLQLKESKEEISVISLISDFSKGN